jgi:hypothetical protein
MATVEEQKEALEKLLVLKQEDLQLEHKMSRQELIKLGLKKDNIAAVQELVSLQRSGVVITEEHVKNLKEEGVAKADILAVTQRLAMAESARAKAVSDIKKEIKDLDKATKKAEESTKAWDAVLDKVNAGFRGLAGVDLKKLFQSPSSLVGEFYKIATSADQAGVDLTRLTGQMDLNATSAVNLAARNRHLGLTNAAAAKIQSDLFASYSDFYFLSEDLRDSTENLAARFKAGGVDAAALGRIMGQLHRGMGFTEKAAIGVARSLLDFATEAGIGPAKLAADFVELSKELSKYGKKGVDVFKSLVKTSKVLALNVTDAMKVATLFDTFSSAASTVGLLNAQLGLGLNTVSMTKADEAERLDILRKSFKLKGMEFGKLHRREQQAVASILKVDVSIADRLLGDPKAWDELRQKKISEEERTAALVSINERLAVVMEQVMEPMMGVAEWLGQIVKTLSEYPLAMKFLVAITALSGALYILIPVLKALKLASLGLMFFSNAAAASGPAMATASVGALPLAAAIALVAAGAAIAAFGMSYLVAEFAKMDAAQILSSAVAIVALGASIALVSYGLAALLPVIPLTGAALGLLALALSAFAIAGWLGLRAMDGLGNSLEKIGIGLTQSASGLASFSFDKITGLSDALENLKNSLFDLSLILLGIGPTGNMGMLMEFFDALAVKSQGFDAIKMNAASELLQTTKEILVAAPQSGGQQNLNGVQDIISSTASAGSGNSGLKSSIDSLVKALNKPQGKGQDGGSQKPFNIIVKIDGEDAAAALWPKLKQHFEETG